MATNYRKYHLEFNTYSTEHIPTGKTQPLQCWPSAVEHVCCFPKHLQKKLFINLYSDASTMKHLLLHRRAKRMRRHRQRNDMETLQTGELYTRTGQSPTKFGVSRPEKLN